MVERYKIIEKIGVDDTVCPRSLDLMHIAAYYIKVVKTSWKYSILGELSWKKYLNLFYSKILGTNPYGP